MVLGLAACGGGGGGDGEVSGEPIVIVYYPNESAGIFQESRDEVERLVREVTGRPVTSMLTTDTVIAVEAIASGTAHIAYMGPTGYIEARNRNSAVDILMVNSGPSGTLEDALYFSWFAVNYDDADLYRDANGNFTIENIEGKRVSFVSASSASGFVVPAAAIADVFGEEIDHDVLLEGDFFSEVLFGLSHQGAMFNLIDGRADFATFTDMVVFPWYIELVSGAHNQVGAVYRVLDDADAPFHNHAGYKFVLIESIAVLNPPWAINRDFFTSEEVEALQAAFTSEESANNPLFFAPTDSDYTGWFAKTDNERFLVVDDSWFDPMRR